MGYIYMIFTIKLSTVSQEIIVAALSPEQRPCCCGDSSINVTELGLFSPLKAGEL